MTDRPAARSAPGLPTAPDLIGPVVGFRAWRVTPEGLCSRTVRTPWTARVLRAGCHPQTVGDFVLEPHEAPHPDCRCGIRADFRPDLDVCRVDHRGVIGIVTVWGRIELHAHGMRAEWAEIQALALAPQWTRRHRDEVRAVADHLGVDLLDAEALEAAADRYGAPLPERLIPGPRPAAPAEVHSEGPARGILVGP